MGKPERHLYEFGPFRLDAKEHQLLRAGEPVALEPKVFDTLLLLIQNSGHLLEKDELMNKVWPDAVIEEGSLTRNISTLRRVLGDGENGLRYIETVPTRGYRFVASVRELQDESPDLIKETHVGAHLITEAEETYQDEVERPGANGKATPFANIKRHKGVAVVTAVGIVIAIAMASYLRYPPTRKAAIDSVAIMPFANVSNDPNVEYFSDGISESLINNLSLLPQLKVIARSSAFKYKGKEVNLQDVARSLGVESIVAGRIVQRGDNLEISVELIDTSDMTQMWGAHYNRGSADLQAVQAEITRAIAEKLRLRLTGAQEQQLTRRATDNPEAYQLYLAGIFHSRKGNMEDCKKALDYLNQAVVLDPNFALAYSGMPAVYSNLSDMRALAPGEAIAKGRAAAEKALELDGTLAEAHSGLAVIKRQEWDWSGAESEYKRSLELNSNLAAAHGNYALFLAVMGRTTEALAENKRAQDLDPLRISFKGIEGGILLSARLYDEALQVFQNVIRMQPDYPLAHSGRASIYAAKGMYAEAINELQTAIKLYGVPNGLMDLGYVYAVSGKRAEALAILSKLKTSKEYVSPTGVALLYTGIGDKEAAFQWLERAYVSHDSQLQYLKVDPRYDSLRSDSRLADLLRRMRLES
jgi:TolB-like protein/DNA-binding winged helix-turn-helix (wHTH) protein/Tfp pilus assembly protein PilF